MILVEVMLSSVSINPEGTSLYILKKIESWWVNSKHEYDEKFNQK